MMNSRKFAKFASMKYIGRTIAIFFIMMLASSCHSNKYTPFIFDNGADYIVNGYYRIVDKNGRIGYADSLGNTTIKPTFAFGLPFNPAGQARVTNTGERKQDGEYWLWESEDWFYIDTKGSRVDEPDIAVFYCPDIQPQFPGGYAAMWDFVSKNLKIPSSCECVKGRIIVEFIVTEEGKVEDVKIKRSASPELDKEFVRIVESFPNFLPGRINGYPVRCRFTLPLNIRFQ